MTIIQSLLFDFRDNALSSTESKGISVFHKFFRSTAYRFWIFNEDFCPSQLVLVRFHVDGLEEMENSLLDIALPLRIRLWR